LGEKKNTSIFFYFKRRKLLWLHLRTCKISNGLYSCVVRLSTAVF
jgi:hypothetical protein